jgi:hypothetical protein
MNNYIREIADKVTETVIPDEVITERNEKKSWKYGYCKEYNIVIISKDGTVGDIFRFNTDDDYLLVAIPLRPDDKYIRFSNFPKEAQKWERYVIPNDLSNYKDLYQPKSDDEEIRILGNIKEKHYAFIKSDIDRVKNGMWQTINGEAVYITGGYYFLLQHIFLTNENIYPKFRFVQLYYYYWLEACYADNRCYGSLLLKSRRIFFSTVGGAEILRSAITNKSGGEYPLISKTNLDINKLFSRYILNPLDKLPIHLLPKIDEKTRSLKSIWFYDRKSRKGRNTTIQTYATTISAYDGAFAVISLNDEIGKIPKVDVGDWWSVYHKRSHETQGVISGKAICGSTAGLYNEGGEAYQKFYNASKLETRNLKIKQTATGLYALFIPAEFSLRECYDKYGHTIFYDPQEPIENELGEFTEIGAKTFLDEKEKSQPSEKDLINQKINFPRTESDAFLNDEGTSMYDSERIQANIAYIKEHQTDPEYKQRVSAYDLFWKDGVPYSTVEHKPNPNGRFLFSWIPPQEYRNKFVIRNGVKYPLYEWIGALGIDPYDVSRAIFGAGSKGSCVGKTKSVGEGFPTDTFFFVYNCRPENENIFYDDMFKVLTFLSMPALVERNKRVLLIKAKENGMRGYMLTRPDKLIKNLSEDEIIYGGMPSSSSSTGGTILLQQNALESYINTHIGIPPSIEEAKCLLLPLLEDWLKYQPIASVRTKRDITVASQFAVLANNKIINKPKPQNNKENIDYFSFFQKAI